MARPVLLVFLDTKMKATNSPENAIFLWMHLAKPMPKPLLRVVEAPLLKKRRDCNVKVAFRGFLLVFVFSWKFFTPTQLKLCKTQTGCRYRVVQRAQAVPKRRRGSAAHVIEGPSGTEAVRRRALK